jgi:ABC-2 type transport system permease protein
MFARIAAFEFRYQIRQPIFWVTAILFFLLTFGATTVDQIMIGSGGNVHKNAPYSLAIVAQIMTLFYMFVITAFVANVVVRDDETGFGPIIRTTRISKFDYLNGRFAGAFLVAVLGFAAIPLGIFLGSLMPWVDPETLGPNHIADYAYAFFLLAVPTLFLFATIFFAAATVTRSMMWTYVCVVGFLIVYTIISSALGSKPELETPLAYAEPLGLGAFGLVTKYWTATERNGALPAFAGVILWNRVIWFAVSLAALAAANGLFRFASRGAKANKKQKLQVLADAASPNVEPGPLPRPRFDGATAWNQLVARTRFEMDGVFRSPAFFVLLALGLFNAIASLLFPQEIYGTEVYPVTRLTIADLQGAFVIVPLIIAIYYSGEVVWRDRERKIHEIIDASAAPDWTFIYPKALAIALVLFSTLLVSVIAGMAIQLFKGYDNFEIGKYLLWYVLPLTIDWTLTAILAVFLQAISPNKYVGWGLLVIYLIARLTLRNLGLQDNLYQFGNTPLVPLSDMNGQGQFWIGAYWFRAYWSAFCLILLILGYGLWRRGTETRLAPRLRRLPGRLRGAAGMTAGAALIVFVATGAFIYVNTHIWNHYRTSIQVDERLAAAEKALLRYEHVPEPSVVSVKTNIELYPHQLRLVAHVAYVLENRHTTALQTIHLNSDPDNVQYDITIAGAHLEREYPEFGYRIYRFEPALAPGARATMTVTALREQRGFRNGGLGTRVVDNGTFVDNSWFTPQIGINRTDFLSDRAKRRKYGLPPELRIPKLEDDSARAKNYIGNADWVTADITVTTDADQTPVAPGYKIADVTAGGRRTAEFKTESPILNFYSVQSAHYVEKHETHAGIDVAVYYDAQHPYNVERMIHAADAGLDYYQKNFSPYQFRQLRFIEFPDYAQFAQSFANTVPWSEGLGFIADNRDPNKIDYVTYVAAHELGHQWWAHQVISADMQGGTMLVETLAQYSALMVMEKLYGPDQIRKFLKYELNSYLSARATEAIEEVPLERVENQAYIHYRKGSLVMYLLKDQIGEDAVNRALRKLLAKYAFKGAPFASSKDLVAYFRAEAPPDKQQLITDLFERITLYDVSATTAVAKKRPDGKYAVHLTVKAKKLYADGKGRETEAAMKNESFDVGLFSIEPGTNGFTSKKVLLFKRVPLSSGTHTFDFVTDVAPAFAGIDPYNKRIDRNADDNIVKVTT